MREHLPGFAGIRPRGSDRLHGLPDLGGAYRFKGSRNLRDVLDAADTQPHFTRRGHASGSPGFTERLQSLLQALTIVVGDHLPPAIRDRSRGAGLHGESHPLN
jgi:hypothetical protein